MYYNNNRGYGDYPDAREMAPKRQRVADQGSSYYGSSPGYVGQPGASFMYNPAPYSAGYTGQPPPFPVVRLRGLPFDCTEAEISEFLRGLDIVDVLLVHKGGRFAGEAYCVLGYPMQVDFALQRNRHNIGRRYVEVFRSKRAEYYKAIANEVEDSRSAGSPHRGARGRASHDERKDLLEHTGILRLRGLPFSAKRHDIKKFFKDFVIEDDAIHVTYNSEGRPSGEAFVEFSSSDDSKGAMVKDNMTLGSRYVELFPATREEMDEAIAKGRAPNPDEEDEAMKHTGVVRMRGLPFSATKEDILEFFNGFVLSEDSVNITLNSDGRASGEAFVEFASPEDSEAAMEKDRKSLGSRYIELFPSTHEDLNEALSKGR